MEKLTSRPFGAMPDGGRVECWTLRNEHGMTAEVLTYGATLRALRVPVGTGFRDVVLGFDGLAGYLDYPGLAMGGIPGRTAGRIGNSAFSLDGETYRVSPSQAPNCLHGGVYGFHRRVWTAGEDENGALALTYVSPDGEEGYPGALTVRVTYALTSGNALAVSYLAKTDRPTPVALTNHSYFNLNGGGDVGGHQVSILADRFAELGEGGVPTGKLLDVAGTPFDLRTPTPLAVGFASAHPQIGAGAGYDHCFAVGDKPCTAPRVVATAQAGGLKLTCESTYPGVVFYTGNYLEAQGGKGGAAYHGREGFCFEAQPFPDAVNHREFPNSILRPGEEYRHITVYRFTAL